MFTVLVPVVNYVASSMSETSSYTNVYSADVHKLSLMCIQRTIVIGDCHASFIWIEVHTAISSVECESEVFIFFKNVILH